MNFDQLKIFVAVAERLHVTQAAQALNITQSSASAAIAALEHKYQVKLFHRVGRRIELTEAGRLFLLPAQDLLARVADAETLFNELAGLERGTISLHTSHTVANYWLPLVVGEFRAAYPKIDLNLAIANSRRVTNAVLHGEADVGLAEGIIDEPALAKLQVHQDNLWVVVGRDHPWAGKRSVDPRELLDTDWVMREPGSGSRTAFERFIEDAGLDPRDLRVVLELPSNGSIRGAVEGGAGAGALPDFHVRRSVEAGTVIRLDITIPPRPYYVLWHKERVRSRAVSAFLDYLSARKAPASGKPSA